ncbi:MAG: hypothetical protein A2136_05480 [Chloroflexi bacterium RBG_16_54_11]|nr:MAG: hypothetical protein A2136_05480 [Chloroflexi bacterium RBG_16_54_11]
MTDIQIGTVRKLEFVLLDTNGDEVTGLGSTFTVTYSKNGAAFAAGSGAKTEVGSGAYTYDQVADETDTRGPLLYEITGAGTDVQRLLFEVVGYAPSQPAGPYILTTSEAATVLRCEEDDPLMLALLSAVDAYIFRATGRRWEDDTTIEEMAKQAARILITQWHEDPAMGASQQAVLSAGLTACLTQLEAMAGYYYTFEGLESAGSITLDVKEGDTVVSLIGRVGATGDQSAKFESVITENGYLQQTSSEDLSEKWYTAYIVPPGEI